MRNRSPADAPGQSGAAVAVRTAVPRRLPPAGEWVNRVPTAFADARTNPIGHRKGWMLLILEGYCRSRCYCWAGNRELAAAFGCSTSTLQELLLEMERDGLIRRVAAETGRNGRAGIILLRRANPDLPTADPESIPDVIRLMREPARETGPAAPGKPGAPSTRKTGPELRALSLEKDGPKKDDPGEQSPQRQRPEPGPLPSPAAPAGPGQVAAPREASAIVDPPDLTPGQREWLGTLGPDERRRFDGLPVAARRRLLAPHLAGPNPDPIIAAEAARILAPTVDPTPAAELPATTAELWARLPGAPRRWAQLAAEAMAQDFGTDRDRKLWPAFHALAEAVRTGGFPAAAVLDAYRQGTGPGAKNRGAVFNTALRRNGWNDAKKTESRTLGGTYR